MEKSSDEGTVAKLLEEMKLMVRELPDRVESRVIDNPERYIKREKRFRKFHPMMLDEMLHMFSKRSNDPIGILIIASFVKDDFPWLYELGVETYRAAKSGTSKELMEALNSFRDAAEMTFHGPFMKEMGFMSKESHMMMREMPMIIDRYAHHFLERGEFSSEFEKGS